MTPTAAFESKFGTEQLAGDTREWRKMQTAWLAACAWQREQDAKVASKTGKSHKKMEVHSEIIHHADNTGQRTGISS